MKKLSILLLVAVFAIGSIFGAMAAEKKVTVANKNFTEQYIIGQMMKQVLEENGFKVELESDLTSFTMRKAMETGSADICAEYTGTAWMTHLGYPYSPDIGHEALHAAVNAVDTTENNLTWLDPIWNHNTYALAVWPEFAEKHDLKTLSDLAELYRKKEGKVSTFIDFEFSQRPDGLPALEEEYNFKIAEGSLKTAGVGASVTALENHNVKMGMVFGTTAAIAKNGWVVLKDNRSFFPPYDLTPLVRSKVLEKYPEIKKVLNELVASFSGGGKDWTPQYTAEARKTWSALNGRVDIEKLDAETVAHEYLVEHGLVEE